MFKVILVVLMAFIALAASKPGVIAPVAYSAPVVAAAGPAGIVVGTQEYHGNFAAPYVGPAPYVASAPYFAASPYVAAPYISAPYVASAAYTAPVLLKK